MTKYMEHILEHRKTVISIRRYDCRGVDHWWFWRRNMYLEHSMQVSILIQIHQANDTPFNPIIKRWKCRYKYYLYRLLYALVLQDHSSPIIFGFSTSRSYIWGLLIWKLKPRNFADLKVYPWKINMEPKNEGLKGYFHLFSFSNRWFSGSMLILQGVQGFVGGFFMFTSDWIARIHKNGPVDGCSE